MKLQALIEQNVLQQEEVIHDRSAQGRERLRELKGEFEDLTEKVRQNEERMNKKRRRLASGDDDFDFEF